MHKPLVEPQLLSLQPPSADIVGFTSWAKDVEPRDVMVLLNTLFSSLDRLTDQFKVHKVKLPHYFA